MQRNRQKKKEALEAGEGDEEGAVSKEAPSATVSYVDRDRAAAVGMEKDIKSNLKVNFACFVDPYLELGEFTFCIIWPSGVIRIGLPV